MYTLYKQAKATADLKNIWKYSYKEFGEAQADNYFDALIEGMNVIQANPCIGVACDYIRNGYRQYKVNHHFIFYSISENSKVIRVVRVLHESMQFCNHFSA